MYIKNAPLVSVILPTYNVARYLLPCLRSVSALTYPNFEVIIIIDGATDGSFDIAKDFCKKDNRFHVYWQENAGSGPARNAGLARANGEFVMFVDPDDWIEPDLLEKLVVAQQEGDYDFVATKRTFVYCDNDDNVISTKPHHFGDEIIEGRDNVRQAYLRLLNMGAVGSPTEKLYKMSIIRNNVIEFPSLRRSQDVAFNMRYYNCVDSLRLLSYSGYNYRIMGLQPTGKSGKDYYKTILWFYEEYQKLYQSWKLSFPKQELCNFFFTVRLNANLQQFIANGWDFKPVVEETTIRQIIQTANPTSLHHKILRRLLLLKYYNLMIIYLRIEMSLKKKGARR